MTTNSSMSSSSSSYSSSNTTTQLATIVPLTSPSSTTPTHLQQSFSIKLNSKNYLPWKLQFQPLLNFYNLHEVLHNIESAPPKEIIDSTTNTLEPNPAYLQWFAKDQLLFSWLLSSISEEIFPHLLGLNSASEVWKALETAYGVVNTAQ